MLAALIGAILSYGFSKLGDAFISLVKTSLIDSSLVDRISSVAPKWEKFMGLKTPGGSMTVGEWFKYEYQLKLLQRAVLSDTLTERKPIIGILFNSTMNEFKFSDEDTMDTLREFINDLVGICILCYRDHLSKDEKIRQALDDRRTEYLANKIDGVVNAVNEHTDRRFDNLGASTEELKVGQQELVDQVQSLRENVVSTPSRLEPLAIISPGYIKPSNSLAAHIMIPLDIDASRTPSKYELQRSLIVDCYNSAVTQYLENDYRLALICCEDSILPIISEIEIDLLINNCQVPIAVYNFIGILNDKLANYPAALEAYGKALDASIKTLGENNLIVADIYNNKGVTHVHDSDFKAARDCHDRAKAIHIIYLKTGNIK